MSKLQQYWLILPLVILTFFAISGIPFLSEKLLRQLSVKRCLFYYYYYCCFVYYVNGNLRAITLQSYIVRRRNRKKKNTRSRFSLSAAFGAREIKRLLYAIRKKFIIARTKCWVEVATRINIDATWSRQNYVNTLLNNGENVAQTP